MERYVETTTFDVQLGALARIERRRLLLALLEADSQGNAPVGVDELAPGIDRREYMAAMQHTHLPRLAGLGFVDWNRQNDHVTAGPAFGDVEPLLELLREHQDELPAEGL